MQRPESKDSTTTPAQDLQTTDSESNRMDSIDLPNRQPRAVNAHWTMASAITAVISGLICSQGAIAQFGAPQTQFAPQPQFNAPTGVNTLPPPTQAPPGTVVPNQQYVPTPPTIPSPTPQAYSNAGQGVGVPPQNYLPPPIPQQSVPQQVAPQRSFPPQQFGPRQRVLLPGESVPGSGTAFPPIGTDPVYSPNVRTADLVVNGFPARTGRIMFGGAVNSDAGVTGQITIDERNFDIMRWPRSFRDMFGGTAFRGAGQTFRLEAAPGSDFDRYSMQFADPNLFGYLPISFSSSGFLYDRRYDDWQEKRIGARFSLGYRITPDLSLAVGIGGQNVKISNIRAPGVAPELDALVGNNELYSGTVSLTHNTRDSPIQPSQGHFFEFMFEETFGDFDYSRIEAEYRKYWLLASRADGSGKQTLSFSTQVGFSGDQTPVFERFFAGGYATLRGFDFRGASPVVGGPNGVAVGGDFQFLNSVEYMFPITADDAFRGVAFCDFGTVESSVKLDKDTFRVAPGLGLRVAIPALGPAPLAFDFAYPVAKADTDQERIFSFYMSLIR